MFLYFLLNFLLQAVLNQQKFAVETLGLLNVVFHLLRFWNVRQLLLNLVWNLSGDLLHLLVVLLLGQLVGELLDEVQVELLESLELLLEELLYVLDLN